jgi:hypothetical protein
VPQWFFSLGILLEIVFAIATAVVAYYAYKVYQLSCQRQSRLIMFGFLFISFSYLVKALVNSFVLTEAREGLRRLSIESLNALGLLGLYTHFVLFTLGLVSFSYMIVKKDNFRLFNLLIVLSLLAIFLARNTFTAFNVVTSVLLVFISLHYGVEYFKNRNKKTLLILAAFILLFLSTIAFIFSSSYYENFVIGHVFELGSYIIMIGTLASLGRKTR